MSGPGSGSPSDGSTPRDDPEDGSVDESSDPPADPPREADATRERANGGERVDAATDDAVNDPATAGDSGREASSGGVTVADDGPFRWFLRSENGTVVAVRDALMSVAIVACIGLLLFGVSGIWPPLVAVESGSMEPNMQKGDLVFVVEEDRFVGDGPIDGTGVVTYTGGANSGHERFGQAGDVIVFRPDGSEVRTPVIHRAHFWVEPGENWVETKANPEYLNGATCGQLETCPAPHAGFVTKGDANSGYDQARGGANTDVVRPEWVTGKGLFRIPWLGYVRLTFDEAVTIAPAVEDAPIAPGAQDGPSLPDPATIAPPEPTTAAAPGSATARGATGSAVAATTALVAAGRRG